MRISMSAELQLENRPYQFGFTTELESDRLPKGIDENIIRQLSALKKEPPYLLEFRLKAFRKWQQMSEPHWAQLHYPNIDYQDICYYSAPKQHDQKKSLDEVDPELLRTLDKLGIPLDEQKRLTNVAVDVVFDSVSIATTFKQKLKDAGVILCSISEAIRDHSELVEKYLGSVVPIGDNFFSTLNSAVFTDGSFVYIPKGVTSPMELSTYFRINDKTTGQFERTLIIAEDDSYVSYLEGCTAPMYDNNQLHAAVVELIALDRAHIKYSTVQNWYPGDPQTGKGGIFNFVTKRGKCAGQSSKICWTQVEVGAAITWKYPSVILQGDRSVGEFYSVALTNHFMQADTGTRMIHLGENTRSTIVSKGISADQSSNTYRGQVTMIGAGSQNYTQCDSMLIGGKCAANTFPDIQVRNSSSVVEHEASTSKLDEEKLFYLLSRGIALEDCINLLVTGFCKDILQVLPLEFASEAQKLLALKLENSVG